MSKYICKEAEISEETNNDKFIVFGDKPFSAKDPKRKITHRVTSIYMTEFNQLNFVVEKGISVNVVTVPMEMAQEIGLIDLSKLSKFL